MSTNIKLKNLETKILDVQSIIKNINSNLKSLKFNIENKLVGHGVDLTFSKKDLSIN